MSPNKATNSTPTSKILPGSASDLMKLLKSRDSELGQLPQQHQVCHSPTERMNKLRDILSEALEILDDEDLF